MNSNAINIVVESVNILSEVRSLVFVLFLSVNVEQVWLKLDAKLVNAKAALLKTISKEVKILSIDLQGFREDRVRQFKIVRIYVVKNVHLRSSISAVCVNCQRTDAEANYHQKVANSVVVWVAILKINLQAPLQALLEIDLSKVRWIIVFIMS